MNLKERGITVGDLVIVTVIIIFSFAFFKIKDSKNKQSAKFNFSFVNSSLKIDLKSNPKYFLFV